MLTMDIIKDRLREARDNAKDMRLLRDNYGESFQIDEDGCILINGLYCLDSLHESAYRMLHRGRG